MPYIGLIPFLRYPSTNPVKLRVSQPVFKGYLSEYSDNKAFLRKNVHVNSLFIFRLFLFYNTFHENTRIFLRKKRACAPLPNMIYYRHRESQRSDLPSQVLSYITQPSTSANSWRLFLSLKDCITQTYKGYNEYTYLNQIRICNIHWHCPPFFRLEGCPSEDGG